MAKSSSVTRVDFYEHSGRESDSEWQFVGYAQVTLNGDFVVTGIRVFENDDGVGRIGMPGNMIGGSGNGDRKRRRSNKNKGSNNWKDTCYPLTDDLRAAITEAVLDEAEIEYDPSIFKKRKRKTEDRKSRNKRDDDYDDYDTDERKPRRKKRKRSKEEYFED